MRSFFTSEFAKAPTVSVVLIDWSCRESFHSIQYLNQQTVPRERYELIWVEYYDRDVPQIRRYLNEYKKKGNHPPVDQWLALDTPREICYHKHVMYNVGILLARGHIVVICDSDAIYNDTFIRTIQDSFSDDKKIVLHLDQVRNNDRRFYPFNYPAIEDVTGRGAVNFKDGTTTGLLDTKDTIHTRNYGGCLAALRSDLIAVGGADEHEDYLGLICGPYDLTFRLVNAGKKEIWHPSELSYHVWHPGQSGLIGVHHSGPHDGKHMSQTALDARANGRVMPLVENQAIAKLRGRKRARVEDALPDRHFSRWKELLDGKVFDIDPVPGGARRHVEGRGHPCISCGQKTAYHEFFLPDVGGFCSYDCFSKHVG